MLTKDCILYISTYLPYQTRLNLRLLSRKLAPHIKGLTLVFNRVCESDYKHLNLFLQTHVSCLVVDIHDIYTVPVVNLDFSSIKKLKLRNYNSYFDIMDAVPFYSMFKNVEEISSLGMNLIDEELSVIPNLRTVKCKGTTNFVILGGDKYLPNLEYLRYGGYPKDLNMLKSISKLKIDRYSICLEHIQDLPLKHLILINVLEVPDLGCFKSLETLELRGETGVTNARIKDLNLKTFVYLGDPENYVFDISHMTNLCLVKSDFFVNTPESFPFNKHK